MELRPEMPGTIRALYETMPQRYHRVAHEALEELAQHGWLWVRTNASRGYVTIPKAQLWQIRTELEMAAANCERHLPVAAD